VPPPPRKGGVVQAGQAKAGPGTLPGMDGTLRDDKTLPRFFPADRRISLVTHACGASGERPLRPEEDRLLSPRAAEKRRVEFSLGRAAAHDAIAGLLGASPHPIGKGENGEPLWPEGLVGSITHSAGTAMAAVGRRTDTGGIGIDLESLPMRAGRDLSRRVCTPGEMAWVMEAADAPEARLRVRMLFSAKESVYKALFPSGRTFLGFQDVELLWQPERRCFRGRLLRPAGPSYPCGHLFDVGCRKTRDFVFTFLCLPPWGV